MSAEERCAPRRAGPEPQRGADTVSIFPAEPPPWTVTLQAPLLCPRSHTQRKGGDGSPGEYLISVSFNAHFHLSSTCERFTICIAVAAAQPRARVHRQTAAPSQIHGATMTLRSGRAGRHRCEAGLSAEV